MSESILSRRSVFYWPSEPAFSATQNQVDGLVTRFVEEAADPKTLASLTAGGLAYRYGKIGVMGSRLGHVTAMPLRPLSIAFGLGSEVTAFEFTNRTLQSFSPSPVTGHPSPSLWSWSGPGGWKQSLINDTITFGLLKGAGYLSRESNVILQHTFSSTAMVAGHQTSSLFGIIPKPEGTLAEQLLHAEVTNLQLGAGTSLVHTMAPGISAWERGLDLSLRSFDRSIVRSWIDSERTHERTNARSNPFFQLASAMAGPPSLKNPHILLMAAPDDPDSQGGGDKTPSTLPSAGTTTERQLSFTTLADLLGVDISSYQPGQDLNKITLAVRTKVMDRISRPEIASKLTRDTLHQLRLFVVGGVGNSAELNRSLQELIENTPPPTPPQALLPATPASPAPIRQEAALIPRPPAVLYLQELPALFRNPRIVTQHPDGRIQISLRGKTNLSLQDYFDFYQLIFHQAREFRQILEQFQNQGVDIQPLAPRVQRMDSILKRAAAHIKEGQEDQARHYLDVVDREVEAFQQDLMTLARQMGAGAPHLAGHLVLYGQNALPPIPLQALPPPVVIQPRPRPEVPLPKEAMDPTPLQGKSFWMSKLNYRIKIGGIERNWYLDFSKHDRFYLTREGNDFYLSHVLPTSKLIGTFQASEQGLLFEPVNRSELIHITDSQNSTFSIPKRFFGGIAAKVERVPHFLSAEIAFQLGQQGAMTPSLEGILMSVLKEEQALIRAAEARRHHCRIHNWENYYAEDIPSQSPFEKALSSLSKDDAERIAEKLVPYWAFPGADPMGDRPLNTRTIGLFMALMPRLSHKAQTEVLERIIDLHFPLFDQALEKHGQHFPKTPRLQFALEKASYTALQKIILPMSIDGRLMGLRLLTDRLFQGNQVRQFDLDLLEPILASFPPEVLIGMTKPSDPRNLRFLILAYAQGLPFVSQIYERYLQAENPEHFIKLAADRVRYFREGGLLFSKDPDHLAFAFGALDNPEQLTFESFVRDIHLQDLPRPFMNTRFRVEVPLVKVAHAQVDKGIVKDAFEAVAKIYRQDLLLDYLKEVLAKPKQNGLSPFREELPTEEIRLENVLDVTRKILKLLSPRQKSLSPQTRDVLQNITLGLAAQSENGQALLPLIAQYNEKMSNDQLLQVLNALREFYGDAVGEILKDHDIKLKWVNQMGERLKKQVDQVKTEAGEFQTIEMIPSKSQTDIFAGYIGEDCTKGRWKEAIQRVDTQVYRMISNKRLVGMIYLKREVLDGKVVLVLGIEPRARFRVNAEGLLNEIIKNLGEIAGQGDYDYLLISTNSGERSNRPDMNDAIERRFRGISPKVFKDHVRGGIFANNQFHVAWERPRGLPKGPPPSESIGDVVSSAAKTTMGYIGKLNPKDLMSPPSSR